MSRPTVGDQVLILEGPGEGSTATIARDDHDGGRPQGSELLPGEQNPAYTRYIGGSGETEPEQRQGLLESPISLLEKCLPE